MPGPRSVGHLVGLGRPWGKWGGRRLPGPLWPGRASLPLLPCCSPSIFSPKQAWGHTPSPRHSAPVLAQPALQGPLLQSSPYKPILHTSLREIFLNTGLCACPARSPALAPQHLGGKVGLPRLILEALHHWAFAPSPNSILGKSHSLLGSRLCSLFHLSLWGPFSGHASSPFQHLTQMSPAPGISLTSVPCSLFPAIHPQNTSWFPHGIIEHFFFPSVLLRDSRQIKIMCLRCTGWCFDMYIHCGIIPSVKFINISSNSHSYLYLMW